VDVEARLTTESFPLPLAFKLGIAFDLVGTEDAFVVMQDHRLTIAVDGIHPNDGDEKVHIGCEYGLYDILFLRGGYKVNYDTQAFTAGAGLQVAVGVRQLCVDYAFVDMDILDATHRLSVTLGF
jgi:hypothetical protein